MDISEKYTIKNVTPLTASAGFEVDKTYSIARTGKSAGNAPIVGKSGDSIMLSLNSAKGLFFSFADIEAAA